MDSLQTTTLVTIATPSLWREGAVDIAAWLRELGLERYEQAFQRGEVDADILPELADADLKELGIPLGPRKKLLKAIAALGDDGGDPVRTSRQETTAAAADAEGDRRQVTVLFADLVGFTSLAGELDAEEVHQLLKRFFDRIDGIVESHGGSIDKHIGDCVMAVFGAPVAHGNDPERAARAALAIRDAMPGLSAASGRELAVHVGIASGQVVARGVGSASHQKYTVTGNSVNLASRLTDRAQAGEILISDMVRRLLPEGFVLDRRGALDVKGIPAPVETWRLVGYQERTESRRRPFVGRLAELRQLEGVLEVCVETGSGQVVHVRGEAGIGKTRLLEELCHRAADMGFGAHTHQVQDFGPADGRDVIQALVRSLLGLSYGAGPAETEKTAGGAVATGIVLEEDRVFLNDLLDLPQPRELRALYDAMDHASRTRGKRATVAGLVENLSQSRPLLLMVEDVHWADRLSLEHLADLSRVVTGCPAVLAMTSRIEGDPLDRAWRQTIGPVPLMTIDLGPLRREEAETLASVYVNAGADLARRCLERAAGHPLFLEQLLSHAEEGAEAVPGSVQSLVQARLDQLEPVDKAALQAASVLGQRFELGALRHLIHSPDYACAAPAEHHLVRHEGDELMFAHALIRDAIYDSLFKARRRELHGHAAEWFARRDLTLYAGHLDRAGDPTAPDAYGEAARGEAAAYRYERAVTLVRRGLELSSPSEVTALARQEGDLCLGLGRMNEARAAYERALEAAERDADRCLAWLGLAAVERVVDHLDEAHAHLDRAETAATALGLKEPLARIHHLRGNLHFPQGRLEECLAEHQRCLDLARSVGSDELEARALGGLGDAYYALGRIASAHNQFDRCIEIARSSGLARIEAAYLYMRGATHHFLNRRQAAWDDCLAAAELGAKVGDQRCEMIGHRFGAQVLLESGEADRAEECALKALAIARRLGARRFEPVCLMNLGTIAALRGNQVEALRLLREAATISRETGVKFMGPSVLGSLALVAETPEERKAALDEGEAILRTGALSFNYFFFYRDAMEVGLRGKDWQLTERYATALDERTREEPLPWTDFHIARARALAAHGRGRRDADLTAELERLAREARRVRLQTALPGLEAALAGDPVTGSAPDACAS